MTPRERELLGAKVAEEQVAYWESKGLGYGRMLCLIGYPRPYARYPGRGLVVAIVRLAWLGLEKA